MEMLDGLRSGGRRAGPMERLDFLGAFDLFGTVYQIPWMETTQHLSGIEVVEAKFDVLHRCLQRCGCLKCCDGRLYRTVKSKRDSQPDAPIVYLDEFRVLVQFRKSLG